MDFGQFDRRHFFAGAGGAFFCTLAGHQLSFDREADLPALAKDIPVPPKVAAASGVADPSPAAGKRATGAEYWIRAEKVNWQIIPTHRDQMLDRRVRGKSHFTAYAYRQYTANFAAPMGPATIPGPLLEVDEGETMTVHFHNKVDVPVTMHPHGIFYANEMDGAYKGKFTDPGGFVQPNKKFTYVWEAHPGTAGTWLYHDHGPTDPVPLFKGMFGSLIVRDPANPTPPDVEFFLVMHSFQPIATGLNQQFECINGRAYAGNTPTLHAQVGDRVAFHVVALDNDFHTFHLHGHRWTDPSGEVIDTKVMGPAESHTFEFVEDNAGRWFYHCHVFTHLHTGMNGWYIVT
jgi:FtsP/CotA-like multicopper oxidase with cupredoxin domain